MPLSTLLLPVRVSTYNAVKDGVPHTAHRLAFNLAMGALKGNEAKFPATPKLVLVRTNQTARRRGLSSEVPISTGRREL